VGKVYSAIISSNRVIEAFSTSIISSRITESESLEKEIEEIRTRRKSLIYRAKRSEKRNQVGDFDANGVFRSPSLSSVPEVSRKTLKRKQATSQLSVFF
jgi:hypothetical protein